jgi:hypothetical protein
VEHDPLARVEVWVDLLQEDFERCILDHYASISFKVSPCTPTHCVPISTMQASYSVKENYHGFKRGS